MHTDSVDSSPGGITRRRMIGYLIAGPTLLSAASLRLTPAAQAAPLPTVQPFDAYDLTDLLTDATRPTANLITIELNDDGTASFALHRAEVGQGITTAAAIVIADELDLPVDKVRITLRDAEATLLFNQFTGASNSMHAIYEPLRTAAAIARLRLLEVAAERLGGSVGDYTTRDGSVIGPRGQRVSYAALARQARVTETRAVEVTLKRRRELRLVGGEHKRIDARAIVTGAKTFAMDEKVPGALPAVICRAPTINGGPGTVMNLAAVKAMPGVSDVVVVPKDQFIPGGVAVVARTFGQCFDAVRALQVDWEPGTTEGKSVESIAKDLAAAELPMTPAPPGTVLDETFIFHFRPGDPLETNCAVADVTADGAEIWSSLKSPIWAQEQIALNLGLPLDAVKVHVSEGGGSFGRHLFCDAAFEAAIVSKAVGRPVKLMWHRTDNFRHGRVHPMTRSRVRIVHTNDTVLSLDQRQTCVQTDFTQGLGEILSSMYAQLPKQNTLGFSQAVFELTANVPYNFGLVTQLLNEVYEYNTFHTSSVRNVYSPNVRTPIELMVDQVARAMGKDPLAFRIEHAKDERMKAVLRTIGEVGRWGRAMPAGTAQGLGCHNEYKGRAACLVEIDCRPETVNRQIEHAYTGPRVTKVVMAVDVGLPINVLGLKAQFMGAAMDGIAQALSYSMHFENGHFLEGSWDDAAYTRQWNTPPEVEIVVLPATTGAPGGAGEFGVAPAMAATACAFARATGTLPKEFPINYRAPLHFEPFPTVPPIPEAPTNGLADAGVGRMRSRASKRKRRRTRKTARGGRHA